MPRAAVGAASPGLVGRCLPPQGSQVASNQVPVEFDGRQMDVRVPAPGWWRAGDTVVLADAAPAGRRPSRRIVGPDTPRADADLVCAVRGTVVRLQVNRSGGMWARVETPAGPVSVLVAAGVGLHVGEEVDGGVTPRAVLISSAL